MNLRNYYKLGTKWSGKSQFLPFLTMESIIIFPPETQDGCKKRVKGDVFLVSEGGNLYCRHIAILTSNPKALTADYKKRLTEIDDDIDMRWLYAKAKWLVLDEPIEYLRRQKTQGTNIREQDVIHQINDAIVDKVLNFEF